jgi:uncharacterized protein YwlG (UPF0340 family)
MILVVEGESMKRTIFLRVDEEDLTELLSINPLCREVEGIGSADATSFHHLSSTVRVEYVSVSTGVWKDKTHVLLRTHLLGTWMVN